MKKDRDKSFPKKFEKVKHKEEDFPKNKHDMPFNKKERTENKRTHEKKHKYKHDYKRRGRDISKGKLNVEMLSYKNSKKIVYTIE